MSTKQRQDIDAWLDSLNPAEITWRDATALRRLIAAQRASEAAEIELRDAVRAANESGLSWAAIGGMLGVSKQAAHRKYAGSD